MLHLARWISLRVYVGNLFQLERPFERDRIVNAAAKEKEVMHFLVALGQLIAGLIVCKDGLELSRNARQFQHGCPGLLPSHDATNLCQVHREYVKRGKLSRERLG